MDLLFTPAKLGTCELKNRIVRSATNEHLSDEKGQVTPLWADTLIELAKNEVGLVITGHFCVDKMQRADAGQPVLDETTDESLLRRACDGVHRYGGKLFFQLSHSGIKGVESVNGAPPKHPEDFTREELDRLVEQFAFAAKKCKESGADGVQVHNAHGYLLSNFLNPEENLRTDEYGGSLENRFRLIERILRAVREACGADFPMIVKADSNGCGDLPRCCGSMSAAAWTAWRSAVSTSTAARGRRRRSIWTRSRRRARGSAFRSSQSAACSRAGPRRKFLHRVSRSCR